MDGLFGIEWLEDAFSVIPEDNATANYDSNGPNLVK
jgi:hypothetical protein